jgi:predicted metal-dependent phosphoesterase TrpH
VIDLHSHTTASDGEHPPEELVRRAAAAGIRTLSVTDHDTVDALEHVDAACRARGMTLVPGIEVSARAAGREVHVLGHFVNPRAPALLAHCAAFRNERVTRMEAMLRKLAALGHVVTMEEVQRVAGGATLGRPHLARVLVNRRVSSSVREAFQSLLGDHGPAFVPRALPDAAEAIALVHAAGGTATLAHPGCSRMDDVHIAPLAEAGLDGLEVFHPDHPPGAVRRFLQMAADLRLVATSGSDFHGENVSPDKRLGTADMPAERLAALQERARSHAQAAPPGG